MSPPLAIFGDRPAFSEPLHVGRPIVGDRQALLQRINDALDRRWLSNNGPYVQELEQRIADWVGVRHCVTTCNGTLALEVLIRALGLDGEVIVPSFTFVATAHALRWHGITPIFCDIDPETHNIDPSQVEERITPRTSAILGVHIWGRACDVKMLTEISRKYNLKLIFDAAHAFACSYQGRMIGNFGDAEVFSFHATKFFHTLEGGAIVTNDDALASEARLMRNFGFADEGSVTSLGTNAKMTEIAAAMGLTLFDDIDELCEINFTNYEHYRRQLERVPGVNIIEYDQNERNNYQYIVLEIDRSIIGLSRDELIEVLTQENILAKRYFSPSCHLMEPYHSRPSEATSRLPETEALAERVLVLPTGSQIGPTGITKICEKIRVAIANGALVSQQLNAATRHASHVDGSVHSASVA